MLGDAFLYDNVTYSVKVFKGRIFPLILQILVLILDLLCTSCPLLQDLLDVSTIASLFESATQSYVVNLMLLLTNEMHEVSLTILLKKKIVL